LAQFLQATSNLGAGRLPVKQSDRREADAAHDFAPKRGNRSREGEFFENPTTDEAPFEFAPELIREVVVWEGC